MDLDAALKAEITQSGPVSVAHFMQCAVSHYYAHHAPFGAAGDFTTAPEISQMFGEMIGAWLVDAWERQGCPDPFVLLECGPGRGTLMVDILRVSSFDRRFAKAARIVMMENSLALRKIQAGVLSGYPVVWVDDLDDSFFRKDHGPIFAVANELLDALPIFQLQFQSGAWHERRIGLDASGDFAFGLGAPVPRVPIAGEEGDVYEFSPAREGFVRDLAALMVEYGGTGLLIDYGHVKTAAGDTLQAMKHHEFVDVLRTVGEADLTSHVDFEALATAARKARAHVFPVVEQGAFLAALGIGFRVQALSKDADPARQEEVRAAYHRLCDADQMGALFKVMALTARPDGGLAGFEESSE